MMMISEMNPTATGKAKMNAERKQPGNVVTLVIEPKPKLARKKHRFRIIEFLNHTGSKSWRVDGYKLDRSRVRENFADLKTAQCRHSNWKPNPSSNRWTRPSAQLS